MSGTARLEKQFQAIVAGDGTATIRYGPNGESWHITRTYVSVSTKVLESFCTIYLNQIGNMYAQDPSFTGSTGDTSDTVYDLFDGDVLYAVWTGADVGSVATVTISGTRSDPYGGFRAIPK